jgi:23S rRNA (cytosine1962-C5)-methyltransferase
MELATAVINRRGEDRLRRGHPWIFRSDVVGVQGPSPGPVVRVTNARQRRLGFAFFSGASEIRLRVFERAEQLPDSFLSDRLEAALAWRQATAAGAQACRLVHGEGDGLPSLIVDRYGEYLVVQTLSEATERLKPQIVDLLVARLQPRGILERNDPKVRRLEGLEQIVGVLHGSVPDTVTVSEGDVRLEVDLRSGQKTGLFLDQRENHQAARVYARGRVLDGFCYDGGFSLQLAADATDVLAVDSSGEALARLARNAEINGFSNVATREANLFDLLRELVSKGEQLDTIVLDPPAFAKSKGAAERAWRGYKEINLRALKLLRPGGYLVTCSCSYHVGEDDFEQILAAAAADAGATVTVVEKRRQSRDHPVVLGVPETHYLKCLILRRLG